MADPLFGGGLADLSPVSGTFEATTNNLPVTTNRNIVAANASHKSLNSSARTAGGFTVTALTNTATSSHVVAYNAAGTPVFRFNLASGTSASFQYWTGAWTTAGSSWTQTTSVNYNYRVDFSGLNSSGGAVTVTVTLADGSETVVANFTVSSLDFTAISDVAAVGGVAPAGGTRYFSTYAIRDGSVLATYVYGNVPTADGTDTDGTGTFASVDDTSTPDTAFISLPTSGNRRSVKNSAARNYGGRTVLGVNVPARMRCGATGPTQVLVYLKIGGTRYYFGGGAGTPITLTTSFLPYNFIWLLNPATAAAWTHAEAIDAAMEWGWEVV